MYDILPIITPDEWKIFSNEINSKDNTLNNTKNKN